MTWIIVTLAFMAVYVLLMIIITWGWFRMPVYSGSADAGLKVSVIVPVRNEEQRLAALVNDMMAQNYPKTDFELLFVDDHSNDRTRQVIHSFIEVFSWEGIRYIKLADFPGREGKKAAIETGVEKASGALIITTDADCRFPKTWLSTLAAYYQAHKPKMMLAPLRMNPGGSLSGSLQSLEFASLVAASAGSASAGFPLLANGSNLAFEKEAFQQVGGYSSNKEYASGDDVFLLQAIRKQFGSKTVHYIKSRDALVSTPALSGFKEFINQRLRWVSKNKGYRDVNVLASGALVYAVNAILPVLIVAGFFNWMAWKAALIWYIAKLVIDFPVLAGVVSFSGIGKTILLLPIMEIVNAFYTSFIGIAGLFIPYEWKGRRY